MSNEEMNTAILELLGWRRYAAFCVDPNDARWPLSRCPNYPRDLNACHEMEKTLTDEQMKNYTYKLFFHCAGANDELEFFICHATAAQRCEAFLRTKGLWK